MADVKRNTLSDTFGRPRVFLPVIHPVSKDIALGSIKTAVESEADGIFLIDQGMNTGDLLGFVREIDGMYPDLWIGINLLGYLPEEVIEMVSVFPIDGVWTDDAGIYEHTDTQPAGERVWKAIAKTGWEGLYFGGVAFKYQRKVPDELLATAARKAAPWMDVVTSSGDGTGSAAAIGKVMELHRGAAGHPLALASGVTPENVDEFLPYVSAYLVATGIETGLYSGVLIPSRTRMLSDKIHGWTP